MIEYFLHSALSRTIEELSFLNGCENKLFGKLEKPRIREVG